MKFNKNISRIRIDVGAGATAPNSAFWLSKYDDMGIILFEPDPLNFKILTKGMDTNQYSHEKRLILNSSEIRFKKKIVAKFHPNACFFFKVAIDNVKYETSKNFYSLEADFRTSSSLLKPISSNLKSKINKKLKSKTINLKFYLKKINFRKYKYIEFLKIDTQGNDLNVIKSCGDYLKKICFVQMEYWAGQEYEGEKSQKECLNNSISYMKNLNFECYYYSSVDALFFNKNLYNEIISNNILDDTIDFKHGLFNKSFFLFGIKGKILFLIKIREIIERIGVLKIIKKTGLYKYIKKYFKSN